MTTRLRTAIGLLACLCANRAPVAAQASDWPSWRGPAHTGASPAGDPPATWSEERNVRWKVALPGGGSGTPIVVGELVYVLAAEGIDASANGTPPDADAATLAPFQRKLTPSGKQRYSIHALRLADGSTAWSDVATEAVPHEGIHQDGSWSSSSAVADDAHVFASFGSRGLFAYDHAGKRLWSRQFGDMQRQGFGEGSTPALHGNTLVVQRDQTGPSTLVALDKRTGEELWRREREERTSWCSPLIVEVNGRPQVVASGARRVRAYDLETGEDVWECAGLTANVVATPVAADGTLYAMSGFNGSALLAIRLADARGDVTGTDAVLWSADKNTPYVPSPLLTGGRLYLVKVNSGIASVLDANTGKVLVDRRRFDTIQNVYASPVAAGGRIYFAGRDGDVEVWAATGDCERLFVNHLDDAFDASPAVAGDALLLRGARSLYCIASDAR